MSGQIVIEDVCKFFGEVQAVNHANITIKEGELFTLLGPSGCGKTTLLRTIAGFYKQTKGNIFFDNKLINDVPAYERNVGMVFQNYAIFPHLTVFENVAYGLKAKKVPKPEIKTRVMEALEMVELTQLKDRLPSDMSGGQQQRIALARAIVIRPNLLLMDEPLSNLDAKLRVRMRADIHTLQKELNITTIYVTHDQEEALAISDRIAVLNEGKILQIGSPYEIYAHPQKQFISSFIGASNFIKCTVSAFNHDTKQAHIHFLETSGLTTLKQNYDGQAILSVRPEDVILSLEKGSKQMVAGEIATTTYLGDKIVYAVRVADGTVIDVQQTAVSYDDLLPEKQKVYLDIPLEKVVLYDQTGEEVL